MQPSTMSKISHHARRRPELIAAGELIPVILGSGTGTDDSETETRSERHTPRPGTTPAVAVLVVPFALQLAATQLPPRRTEVELEHARQLLGPEPEQLEQLLSHDWQLPLVVSKNCVLEHVGRQRPLESTGRLGGQLEH